MKRQEERHKAEVERNKKERKEDEERRVREEERKEARRLKEKKEEEEKRAKEKKEEKEKRQRERAEDVERNAQATRAQEETNKHNSMLIKMLVAKLNVETTATPETSVETFSFPFKSDENGSKVLTTPIGKYGKGIPFETNGVIALPVSTLT